MADRPEGTAHLLHRSAWARGAAKWLDQFWMKLASLRLKLKGRATKRINANDGNSNNCAGAKSVRVNADQARAFECLHLLGRWPSITVASKTPGRRLSWKPLAA